MPLEFDTIIIGAGLSGLSLAKALKDKNKSSAIIEKKNQTGGAIESYRQNGFLVESGPNSFLVKSEEVWDFLRKLPNFKSELIEANPKASRRFLVHRGKIVAIPSSPLRGLTTPLYGIADKFKLLGEPFRERSSKDEESVSEFVTRRMSPAFLEYGIAPLVSGVFAGNPDELSIRYAFPKVWNLEQNYGSLIGGAIKLKRERKKQGMLPFKSKMISYRNGLIELPKQLEKEANTEMFLSSKIKSIQKIDQGWQVVIIDSEGDEVNLRGRNLVCTIPLHQLNKLPFGKVFKSKIPPLAKVKYPPVITLMLGFKKDAFQHPLDGFGFLVPRKEKLPILGTIFSSSLFENRAPEGHVNLMTFIGGMIQSEMADKPIDQLVSITTQQFKNLLGLKASPIVQAHKHWKKAIPQYNLGHGSTLEQLKSIETQFQGFHFCGNFRGGPGLNDCVQSALNLAKKL